MSIRKKIASVIGTGNSFRLKYQFFDFTPDSIRIDICAYCQAECPFCPRVYMPEGRKKGNMDMDFYVELLNQAQEMGIKKLKLYITSEPTLHPKFSQMIDKAKELGFKLYISTNAGTLHKHIETFKKIDVIQFSIEGWDKESYEKYRVPLKFDRVYENIKTYSESAKDVEQFTSIHLPLTRKTDLEKFLLLWGNFVDQVRIDFMQPANIYSQGVMKSGFSDLLDDDYYDFQQATDDFVCFDPFEEITVGYDGKILLCCLDFSGSYDLGNAGEGLQTVHTNSAIKKVREQFYKQKMDVCKNCSLFYKPSAAAIQQVREKLNAFNEKHKIRANVVFQS